MPSHCQVVWRHLYGPKLPLVTGIADEAPDNEGEETAEEMDEDGDYVTAENCEDERSGSSTTEEESGAVAGRTMSPKTDRKQAKPKQKRRARFEAAGKALGKFSNRDEAAQAEEEQRLRGKKEADDVMKGVRRKVREEDKAKKKAEKEQAQASSQHASRSVSAPSLDKPDKPEAEVSKDEKSDEEEPKKKKPDKPNGGKDEKSDMPKLCDKDNSGEASCQFLTRDELQQAMLDGAREMSNLVNSLMDDLKSRIAALI